MLILSGSCVLLFAAGCAQRADMGSASSETYTGAGYGADVNASSDAAIAPSRASAQTTKGAGARALTGPDVVRYQPPQPTPAPGAQLDTSSGSAEYIDQSTQTTKGAGAKALTQNDEANQAVVGPVLTSRGNLDTSEAAQKTTKGAGARSLTSQDETAQGGSFVAGESSGTIGSSEELAATDSDFVRQAAQAGFAEVRLGQLAQQKSDESALKNFGGTIVADHQKANNELMRIASQKGIQAPTAMSSRQEDMIQRLSSASGADFDRLAKKEAVQAHQRAIRLFKNEAQHGQDPELKAFAQKTLPKLQEHLTMAQQLPGTNAGSENP
ncbi:MAG TPA: DUF4142 domain-containing protein [Verrucomicrobiae bacterium]|nr:DUF4142 domain-containing protein [Verrucomicrobiae bacterium]